LLLLAVDPVFRGRGLGTLLLEHLIGAARSNGSDRIFLEMRRDNPAEQLYRNLGFAPVGKRPNYYRMLNGTRVDAITFAISI
jgi:ribosomal-protein-alanine N-acetyltransferase